MIQVKDDVLVGRLNSPVRKMEAVPLEERALAPSLRINQWIRSLNKWQKILEGWKSEAALIEKLIQTSLTGNENIFVRLDELFRHLRELTTVDMANLEKEILDMQHNMDLLQRYIINTDQKISDAKVKIQNLSEKYRLLKNRIFVELTKSYPLQIV